MLSPCSHKCGNPSFENLNELSLSQSATSSPLLDLMMNSCVETRSIVHFPRILHCHLVNYVDLFFLGILPPIKTEPRSDMMVGTYFQEI